MALTSPSNSPDVYLIQPLLDVQDNQSDSWRPQFPKPTLMGLASPHRDVQEYFGSQLRPNFFFYLRVLFLCLTLLHPPSSGLSFSSFIWLKTRGQYVIKKQLANKKEHFDEKRALRKKGLHNLGPAFYHLLFFTRCLSCYCRGHMVASD